jgi:signal transduction histidine kinase
MTTPRFNLSRWFAVVALLSISALALAVGWSLNRFITQRMVAQEASLTREFVMSLLMVETPLQRFVAAPSPTLAIELAEAFEHLSRMPDVLRANLYDHQRRLIWSSDPQLAGRTFGPNAELDRALAGEVVAKRDLHDHAGDGKTEHQALRERDQMFIEIYVPVPSVEGDSVIGAIEFYKRPQALARALAELRTYIAVGAAAGALLLFAALYGLVRRADRTIQAQQQQIVEQTTLAALGEMSGAVAHGIRNPLASIRSSAELIPGADAARTEEAVRDIVAISDRLEAWVRDLLSYTQPLTPGAASVALAPLVARCLDGHARELQRRGIAAETGLPADLPPVRGDARLLEQVLHGLLANAIEALGAGGRIAVRGCGTREGVLLEVQDNGPGLTPEQLAKVGQPFYTTKPRGLGVGLALSRRVLDRCGGRLEIESAPGHGTVVRLRLRSA